MNKRRGIVCQSSLVTAAKAAQLQVGRHLHTRTSAEVASSGCASSKAHSTRVTWSRLGEPSSWIGLVSLTNVVESSTVAYFRSVNQGITQQTQFFVAFARLVETAAPGIVAIQSDHARSSGFFWRPGLVVTADEALSEEGDFAVTLAAGDSIKVQLVGRDPTTVIAARV
jgi:S1-C subfamily serine protease